MLLFTSTVRVAPHAVSMVNWLALAFMLTNVPVTKPNGGGCPAAAAGVCESEMPFAAPRFTDRSDWMMVLR